MSASDATLHPAPYVTIPLASVLTGLTEKAIQRKIEEGVWIEGHQYKRGPDGRVYISMKGFEKWVQAGSMSGRGQSASRSRSTENKSAERSV